MSRILAVGLVLMTLAACAGRVIPQPSPGVAPVAARTSALDQREEGLRSGVEQAREDAATASAREASARDRGDAAQAAQAATEKRIAEALAKVRAQNLAEAATAAKEARREMAEATEAAAEQARREAVAQAREDDRRRAWWCGAAGLGGGVILAGLGWWIGLGPGLGIILAAAGLAVAAYGDASPWLLPAIVIIGAIVGAILVLRSHSVTRTVGAFWADYADRLPEAERAAADLANVASQSPAIRPAIDAALDVRGWFTRLVSRVLHHD